MDTLNNLSFIDLILGRDYAEIKGLKGATSFLSDLPDTYSIDAQNLKNECEKIHKESGKTEFSLRYNNRIYRITVLSSVF
ncbi:conjugal transfer protein, partial [Salmonella enterica subsp. arizonae]|nr:conjugal transfer protein [Salmonella enterica subsp. arizonae]